MLQKLALSLILLAIIINAQYAQILDNSDISKLYKGVWAILIYRTNDKFSTPILQKWPEIITKVDNATYTWGQIDTSQTRIISVLEVKAVPSIKFIENGQVWTFGKVMEVDKIIEFLKRPNKNARWSNYLPSSYSIWTKWQYDLYFYLLDYQDYFSHVLHSKVGWGKRGLGSLIDMAKDSLWGLANKNFEGEQDENPHHGGGVHKDKGNNDKDL